MFSRKRLFYWFLLLLLGAIAIWQAPADHADAPVVDAAAKPRARPVPAPARSAWVLPERSADGFAPLGQDGPFAVRSWRPTAAAPVVAVAATAVAEPAATPVAPPLPFAYAGKMEQSPGHWILYLSRDNESFAVSPGDTFDNVYRLRGIENGNLVIEYLPLSTKQLLPIGAD